MQLLQADARELPFPAKTFDLVFGSPPWDDPDLLNEVRPELERVLKRRGRMIFLLPHTDPNLATLAFANRDWTERQSFACERPRVRKGPRYFSPSDKFVRGVLNGIPPGSLLDPFCGTGTMPRVASRMGWDAVGCDIDGGTFADV